MVFCASLQLEGQRPPSGGVNIQARMDVFSYTCKIISTKHLIHKCSASTLRETQAESGRCVLSQTPSKKTKRKNIIKVGEICFPHKPAAQAETEIQLKGFWKFCIRREKSSWKPSSIWLSRIGKCSVGLSGPGFASPGFHVVV